MTQLQMADVFAPGVFPTHTYSPRQKEEKGFERWWNYDPGKVLAVAGPSKTGKTVLVHKLLDSKDPIWIDCQGIKGIDDMWHRIADKLQIYTAVGGAKNISDARTVAGGGQVGFPGTNIKGTYENTITTNDGETHGRDRALGTAVSEALLAGNRPLVLDDVHFLTSIVQTEVLQALKHLVFDRQRVILISIGHRVRDVITSLPDMSERIHPLDVGYWDHRELSAIASKGFGLLHVTDESSEFAERLAAQSFGSPHLMQQFCRDLCLDPANSIEESQAQLTPLHAPVAGWNNFFIDELDQIKARGWVEKLSNGPEERGSKRVARPLVDGRVLDGYQLVLVATASTGPKLDLSKAELSTALNDLVAPHESGRRLAVPTQLLNNMTLIARTRLNEKTPSLEKLRRQQEEGIDPYSEFDLQPVLEYFDRGPNSRLHILDPFFAFYLAWGYDAWLVEKAAQTNTENEDSTELEMEWDEEG